MCEVWWNPDFGMMIPRHALVNRVLTHAILEFSFSGVPVDLSVFRVRAPGFHLEFLILNGVVTLRRNGESASVPLSAGVRLHRHRVVVGWNRDSLVVGVKEGEAASRNSVVRTSPIVPSFQLRTHLRDLTMAAEAHYESPMAAFQALSEAFSQVQEKLTSTGAWRAFWDLRRDGNRIVGRTPKREVEGQSTLAALLCDQAYLKSFDVISEYPAAAGAVDFLVEAPLLDGARWRCCVEVKNAHHAELVHGATRQLPRYMEALGTDYGMLVVLDYFIDTGILIDCCLVERW